MTSVSVPPLKDQLSWANMNVFPAGSLPLALVHVGAYIRNGIYSLQEYPLLQANQRTEMMRRTPSRFIDDYEHSVYATWELSASHISRISNGERGGVAVEAMELLHVLPFFHWAGISESIFVKAHERLRTAQNSGELPPYRRFLQIENSRWDSIRFQEAMSLLSSFSIVSKDMSTIPSSVFSMHSLVHAWTRDRLEGSVMQESRALAIAILGSVITASSEPVDFAFRHGLEPHIDSAFSSERGAKLASKYYKLCIYLPISELEEVRINAKIAQVRSECFRLEEAKKIYETVTKRLAKLRGPDDGETLRELANLGKVKLELLEFKEARPLFERLYHIRLGQHGCENPDTLSSLIDLAVVYDRRGDLTQARQLLESALSILEGIEMQRIHLDPDLKDKCLTRHAIVYLQLDPGSVDNAHRRIDQIVRSGIITPAGVMSLTDFALAFKMLGKNMEARSTWQKVALEGGPILGTSHPIIRYAFQQSGFSSRGPIYLAHETREDRAVAIGKGRVPALGDWEPRELIAFMGRISPRRHGPQRWM